MSSEKTLARALTNALNPFFIFTALYALVAFTRSTFPEALLYIALEAFAAAFVAGYVLFMRRRRRVSDFWISDRTERLLPAIILLLSFAGLLAALSLIDAPESLLLTTLSMGLAAGTVAAVTLLWKASAHAAVAGHAAAAGVLLLGPVGAALVFLLPLVVWSRVTLDAHTLAQAVVGAGVGIAFALLFLA